MGKFKAYVRLFGRAGTVMRVIFQTVKCKYCGSKEIVKYGSVHGVQRWFCKKCNRKFVDNNSLPRMKATVEQIASVIDMYYSGMSLRQISRHLDHMGKDKPSASTIYRWVVRFSKQAAESTNKYIPNVGNVWVADETMLKIGGKKIWLYDIIDEKTRFLLATHMALSRRIVDAETLMKKAMERAGGQIPRFVLTDHNNSYPDGIEFAFENRVRHIPVKGITAEVNTNLIERFHSTLKSREKVARGLKKPQSAKRILEGWLVFYNFFRPHESLNDKTPAQKAGIDSPVKTWMDVVTLKSELKPQIATETVSVRFPSTELETSTRVSPVKPKITKLKPRKPREQKPDGSIYMAINPKGKVNIISRRPIKGAKRQIRKRGRIIR